MNRSEGVAGPDGTAGAIRREMRGVALHITLTGEIDCELDDDLAEAAHTAVQRRVPVIVDASAVTFMDSTGAAFLSGLYREVPLTVIASPPVMFLMKVLSLEDVVAAPHLSA